MRLTAIVIKSVDVQVERDGDEVRVQVEIDTPHGIVRVTELALGEGEEYAHTRASPPRSGDLTRPWE